MTKKSIFFSLFILMFFSIIVPKTSANEQTVFGPKDFEIGSFHIHLSRHSFSVANPGDGYISITKNTPEKAINAGFLFFNGKFIPLTQYLVGDDIVLYQDIILKSSNYLTVFLGGAPGASINIKIENVDSPIPPPTINFTANPQSVVSGDISTLAWNVTDADIVLIDNDIGYVSSSGSLVLTPQETTIYTLGAIGPGGTATESITITVSPLPPTVEIVATPESILLGESTTLTWVSTEADACVIEPDIYEVDPNGTVTLSPIETTSYTIIATGSGGIATDEVTVTVLNPQPTVVFSADPETILSGESSTLAWSSEYADTCVIEPGIGMVTDSGSMTVSPIETTTYSLTATGPGGSVTEQTTVAVIITPEVGLVISDSEIDYGESVTLSWSADGYDTVFLNDGTGVSEELPNGSRLVTPEYTTTYSLSASNAEGPIHLTASVKVLGHAPEPQPEGSFGTQYEDLVPEDASLASYEPKRFSLITGLVEDMAALPVGDVVVTIFDHPEYGSVLTDIDGRFSIPVEGRKMFNVVYTKEGLLESHRNVYVSGNDITIVETVQMVAEDSAATVVAFDGSPSTIVTHQSSDVSDAFGTRACSLVFSGDNHAYSLDENGYDGQELSAITVRATEYTTPASMPAKLPPNSAFTYCAELSVDGTRDVRFSDPVAIWVDNFLGFDVGEVVPVGFYDRNRGVWEPADNGVVVKLLDTDADTIVDALDADGDDQPDDLNNNGSFTDEVKGLQDPLQYLPDTTFWRTETTHFTPCDLNFPRGTPDDATTPNPPTNASGGNESDIDGPCTSNIASFVEERSRVFFEDMPIPGTDMKLVYTSSRVPGYKTIIQVPVSGESVPASLKRITVSLEVAGQTITQDLDPLPDQIAEFFWDGLDHLGRPLQTPIVAHVKIGFVYDSTYYTAGDFDQAFGQPGVEATEVPGREEIILSQANDLFVTPAYSKGTRDFAEGWSISPHHHMNLQDLSTLHKGDGTAIRSNVRVTSKIAGTGTFGGSGIGGPAINADIGAPTRLAVDSAGNVYVASPYGAIYKIDTNGIMDYLTGRYQQWGFSGDGGPAIEARIDDPEGIAIDSNDNIYFSDYRMHCIRKIDANGIINTIAGMPGSPGYSGDGGPASQAQLSYPRGVAVDDIGNLYIAEMSNDCIRKIDTNGIITTIAGGNGQGYSGNGGPAIDAQLNRPDGIAVDQAGNIYMTEYYAGWVVRRIDTNGIINVFAGTGIRGFSGDGGPAIDAQFSWVKDVAVDSIGNVYIADDSNSRIRMVNTNGVITTIAGSGIYGWQPNTVPATLDKFRHPLGIAVDDDINIYISDNDNHLVKKVHYPSAFTKEITTGGNVFSEDSEQGHIVSSDGYHAMTVDLDTGTILQTYQYNDDNKLLSITDRFGNVTEISRAVDGSPTAIISPEGITTGLTIDMDNHLTRIDYPDSHDYVFEYTSDGLLTAKIEPEENRFEHLFDENGRLIHASDQEGGSWAYDKMVYPNGDSLTEVTTAEGNSTTYQDRTESSGAYTSTITGPAGAETFYTRSADGISSTKSLPCGMDLSFAYDLEAEYYYKFVKEMVETTPGGIERTVTRDKTYQDTNYDGTAEIITETVSMNNKTASIQNDLTVSQETSTSPEGRVVTRAYDPLTLLTSSLSIPGRYDTTYGYDTRGRPISTMTGTRETVYSYNNQGFLESVTDAESHTTSFAYDDMGRVTRIDRPDSSSLWFSYDDNGNMTLLTNPNTIDHGFGYNKVNLNDAYLTPLSGNYSFEYDRDRQLTRINFPSGSQIDNIYDATRLMQVQTPEGNIDYTYLCGDKVESMTNGPDSITYAYDGKLLTSETLSGTLNQALFYDYNDDFNTTFFTYAGETTGYLYDDDGLLTGAGIFTITRNADNGLPEAVSSASLSLNRTFNGYGEIDTETSIVNGLAVNSWNITRDNNGRITQKTETASGTTSDYAYTYDAMGRLLTVTKDSTLVEEYQYNATGTRTYEMNSLRGLPGRSFTYSDEDHLLMAGNVNYQYDPDGFLTTKTDGADITQYNYSTRGELLSVTLPDNTLIEYLHDPSGRRSAKKVNGTITEKYLWQGFTRLLAVYDGSDSLLMRFEYADGRMPAAMTRAGIRYYLSYDQVGSLKTVADGTGNVVKEITYDSFGNLISDSDPSFEVPFGFAGGLHDNDTGLVRFGYRDYDPDIGRWTAKDPIFFAGGDTDLYGYVLNDPINFVDPIGTDAKSKTTIFLINFLRTSNLVSPLPLEALNTQPYMKELLKVNPIFGAFASIILFPNEISGIITGPDGRQYFADELYPSDSNGSPCYR